jgi:uncharacterized SAM-binding protein YcdF (DUF218 family)
LLWVALSLYALVKLARRQWRLAGCPLLAAICIYVVGATSLPWRLAASLERPYAGRELASLAAADAVVMLGGITRPSPHEFFGFHFDAEADRVVTAIELLRQRKGRALVLGGGLDDRRPNPGEGELLRRWIETWNVPPAPVHVLGICENTRDEAARTRALAEAQGWQRIILVTSAAHMRRAEATFRRAGLDVVPWACDFDALSALPRPWRDALLPSVTGFQKLGQYFHEKVGMWVYRWRGWV